MTKPIFLFLLLALCAFSMPSISTANSSLRIIKFEADWCGACQKMKPAFEKVSQKYSDVSFQTVDVDSQKSMADRYNVEVLPTVVALKNGRVVGRSTGYMNAFQLNMFVKKHQ